MRYEPIDSKLFKDNRQKFCARMEGNSIAVFTANDIQPTSADGTRAFIQHSELFYLTGVDQEESILVLYPNAHKSEHKEILFVKRTDEQIAIWEGEKLTKSQATEISDIQTVYWLEEFESVFEKLVFSAEHIYLSTNEHLRASKEVQSRSDRFISWCKAHYPLHSYKRSAPIMHRLRAIKSRIEVELMREACEITERGFRRLLSFVKPGVMEYEIEAELSHEFLRNRSRRFAYEPIIASGRNSCILHYQDNSQKCKDGDILLLDIGAEYANYSADLSRTIPVNGRFTQRQKSVYNAVLHVQKEAMKILRPGTTLEEYHKEVGHIMTSALIDIGLLDKTDVKNQDPKNPLYKKYFMHGTSHFIGIDVHDYGIADNPIEVGMAFTVEPGIYILEEELGVRIENDIVITQNGYVDLMETTPIEVEEIEDLMNQ
ncbi:MAG: aminopeptidase P N-terminal domain-containing protein [Bernardetiaceae bacterium]|nr:aminopeptidase P N-terminal domain-containing protein [Bernardetiaceae bacterium]